MKKCRPKSVAAVLFLVLTVFVFPASSLAQGQGVFGPKDFRIGQWHFHLSLHQFNVDARGEGLVLVDKKTPDKRMEGGFLLLNGRLISLQDFLKGENQSTKRKVSLRSRNFLTVFLRGAPGATISIEVQKRTATPAPEVSFQAEPQAVTLGETSTLQWTTTYADRITIDHGIGDVGAGGSLTVSPKETTAYTLTATGEGGTTTASATVRVTVPPPTVSLTLDPDTIIQGASATLTWASAFADTVNIQPGIGTVSPIGSITINPQQTTSYVITVTGPGGSASASVTVTVHQPPRVTLTASPQTVILGAGSTLSWSSTDADTATIDPGIGSVPPDGSMEISPQATTTYTITVNGSGGSSTSSVTVTVLHPPEVQLSAEPQTILAGAPATLSWSSMHAETAAIEPGIGSVDLNGSIEVSPGETTSYVITVTGPGGTSQSTAIVTVLYPPTIQISASPETILKGEFSTLSWTSTHAESCAIEPGIGGVDPNGFVEVTPATTTEYVITASGPGGTTTDSVQVLVIPAFEYESYGLEEDEQKGGGGLIAEGIRILNGNVVEVRADLDFPSPNRLGLRLISVYNSRYEKLGSMGHGWTHTYEVTLEPEFAIEGVPCIRIIDHTAKTFYFREEMPGEYSGLYGEHSRVKTQAGEYFWYRLDGSRYTFSSTGRLVRMEDAAGNRLGLIYDLNNRLERVVDTASGRGLTFHYAGDRLDQVIGPVTGAVPDGVWVTYGYDGSHNLGSVIYADGSGFSYSYNDPNDIHNLTRKKNLLDHVLREWSYNADDQATSCLTPDGKGIISVTYGHSQVAVRDVYDVLRTYTLATIDGRRKVTLMTGITNAPYAESNTFRWAYDEKARLTEVAYGGGRVDLYQDYDDRGNAGTVILASGSAEQRILHYTYHPEMNVPLSRTEASVLQKDGSKVTIWDYDDDYDAIPNESPARLLSRLIERGYTADENGAVIPYEYITTFTYNDRGQVVSIDGPRPGNGDTTTFAYHSGTGDPASVTQPLIGGTLFSDYDAAGRPGRITDVNNRAQGFAYEGRGRITSVVNYADDPASATRFSYVGGLLDSVTDPDGVVQYFDYDAQYGRLTTVIDGDGNYISHTYESYPRGNLVERAKYNSTHERTSRTRWSYEHPDFPGKLYREIQADDTYLEYGYDAAGNVVYSMDPNGNQTGYAYDLLSRLETVTQKVHDPDPRDVITGYGYDIHGNLAAVADGESNETNYVYDDMGRVVSTISPDTGTTTYAYDEAGDLTSKRDAKAVTVGYTYDNMNRITLADYPGTAEDMVYTYDEGVDGKGRLTTMVDTSGTMRFGYDPRGRMIQKTSNIGGVNYPVTYGYTPGGKVASVTYPSGRTISYGRNALGKISEVRASGIAAPLVSGLTYRPFGGPLGLTNGSGGTVDNKAGECDCITVSNPGDPRERVYGYDANRNLTSITGTTTPWYSQSFGYDELNRLSSANGRYGSISYTYDDAGNRLTRNTNGVNESFTYFQGTNRLHQITGGANPRIFSYDDNGNIAGDGTLSFIYDQNNQLKEVKKGETTIATYTYNGLGQRVKKEVGEDATIYHYDLDGKLIAESLPNGTTTKEYLYMGKVRIAMVEFGAEGETVYHYLNDRLGSPEILTDANGTVVWEAWYEPFGEAHIHPSSSVVNNHRLPGQYFDHETGLHYNYHRYYDPKTGRYLTPDPIGQQGGINLFAYSLCNPVHTTDPFGLWGLAGAVGGAFTFFGYRGAYDVEFRIIKDSLKPLLKGWSFGITYTYSWTNYWSHQECEQDSPYTPFAWGMEHDAGTRLMLTNANDIEQVIGNSISIVGMAAGAGWHGLSVEMSVMTEADYQTLIMNGVEPVWELAGSVHPMPGYTLGAEAHVNTRNTTKELFIFRQE